MSALTPAMLTALRNAGALLNARRYGEARALLEQVVRAAPRSADAQYLLGAALRMTGEPGRGEQALRAALAIEPARDDVVLELVRLLNTAGRHADALDASKAAAGRQRPAQPLLVERGRAFAALGRTKDNLETRERIAALYPADPRAHHNLAAALGDAGLAERAETAARAAFGRGGDAPETWLVLARALQAQNRFDEADHAFGEALLRRPLYLDALRDRAQLVWMRTGNLSAALVGLESALAAAPAQEAGKVRAVLARLYANAGDAEAGYQLIVAGGLRNDPALEIAAADLSLHSDPGRALDHALAAEKLAPGDEGVARKLVDTWLAVSEPALALRRLAELRARYPLDQALIAAEWTAWRLSGDERADALYDYERMVLAQTIATPPGWSTLKDYLADLSAALRRLHQLGAHPLDQSLRHGTQTSVNLLLSEEPAIRAFVGAIDPPIRHYLASVGQGADPIRSRNRGEYRLSGMWSVKLASRGFHVDHVHPLGWLSSAFYVDLPPALQADGASEERSEGWIKFGQPGTPTQPQLLAQHYVRPAEGRLVIFPSFMWHGTVPFAAGERLSIAFDAVPG